MDVIASDGRARGTEVASDEPEPNRTVRLANSRVPVRQSHCAPPGTPIDAEAAIRDRRHGPCETQVAPRDVPKQRDSDSIRTPDGSA
jgi:hypothetical protein